MTERSKYTYVRLHEYLGPLVLQIIWGTIKMELNCPWNCYVNMASHADFEHCQIIWHTQ